VISEEARVAAADEFIRIYGTPAARMAFLDSLRHILLEQPKPFWERIKRIRVPALIVWGEKDHLVPVRHAPKLADALREGELVIMPNVGHVPQFEAVKETSRLLSRFLKRTFAGIKPV
jgi:pimeloyl-ACP methyl ester carboxylesterase